ncbi:hypothetical protein TIFTF001_056551 [Ficus carica]|uniref:Uncharacterized protein n=1 Tax=Ficus carica TaxID=3494 RepID=A0AA88JI38_FICCA|nr:hypothetical protein TIFTF001_056551 [Ficus carica]
MLIRVSIICDIASLSSFWVSGFVSSAKSMEKNVVDKRFREVMKTTLPISTDSPAWHLLRTSRKSSCTLLCLRYYDRCDFAELRTHKWSVRIGKPGNWPRICGVCHRAPGGFLLWEEVLGEVEVAFCFRKLHMNGRLELRKKGLEQDKLSW